MDRSNIKMSSGVHKHRSPDDDEGVSPYFGMGANWMFLGYLGRPSSLALAGSWSRRKTPLISIPGQTQLVSIVRQSVKEKENSDFITGADSASYPCKPVSIVGGNYYCINQSINQSINHFIADK